MITQVLHCPYCQSTDIVRHGTTSEGEQRYRCRACRLGRGRTFLLVYPYAGLSPEVKQQTVEMAMNASGIRDTARVARESDHCWICSHDPGHMWEAISPQPVLTRFMRLQKEL
jgi:transposase-like protein